MRFGEPWLLLGLGLLWVVWRVGARGFRTVPAAQHRRAVVARMAAVALLVVALAGPLLMLAVDRTTVLFVVDHSASMGAAGIAAADDFVRTALEGANPDDWSGVVVFGGDARMDQSLVAGRGFRRAQTVVDEGATDIAGALRAAFSLLPSEGSRKVVLITDGVETVGSAREIAETYADAGVGVDVVLIESLFVPDALLASIDAPPVAREGDEVPISVVIDSTISGAASLSYFDGAETRVLPMTLAVGLTRVDLTVRAERPGSLPVAARIDAIDDARPENDFAQAIIRVEGPGSVLIIEGVPGEGAELAEALRAGGLGIDRASSIPELDALLGYDGVVLVNHPAPSDSAAEALRVFVEELGRGLVVVGGDRAYGMGDYASSDLEALLPVSSNPDDMIRRQPVAEVLAIDTSGSMAACHCGDVGESTGVNKTDLSRAGAALAIGALDARDMVGVVAFGSGVDWVIPLDLRPDAAVAEEALGQMFANGDTEIAAGLTAAMEALAGVQTGLRHIVLFTDGWDPNEAGLLPLVREIAAQGITLSVLGTGEGPGETLARMATIGGGRYYEGADLASIPEIFVEETRTVARNLIQEGVFYPAMGAASAATVGLDVAPPLAGYVLATPKGTARVALEVGERDPLLATWRRGLGQVTAWTSDATTRWSSEWVVWDRYVGFWGQVVREALPVEGEGVPSLRIDRGSLAITADPGSIPDAATVSARVSMPDGSLRIVPLALTPAGAFSATMPAELPGTYGVVVVVEAAGTVVSQASSGVVSGYSAEYANLEPDPGLPPELASRTGGVVDPEPDTVFAPLVRRGAAEVPLWPWLVGAALLLFALDVTLRRLNLSDEEIVVASAVSVPAPPKAPPPPPPLPPEDVTSSETMGRLLRRRRR